VSLAGEEGFVNKIKNEEWARPGAGEQVCALRVAVYTTPRTTHHAPRTTHHAHAPRTTHYTLRITLILILDCIDQVGGEFGAGVVCYIGQWRL
jgi:hypothetical protein